MYVIIIQFSTVAAHGTQPRAADSRQRPHPKDQILLKIALRLNSPYKAKFALRLNNTKSGPRGRCVS